MNAKDLDVTVTVNWIQAEGYNYTFPALMASTTQPVHLPIEPVEYNFFDLILKVSNWLAAFEQGIVCSVCFSDDTPVEIIQAFIDRIPTYIELLGLEELSALELDYRRVDIVR